MLTKSKFFFIGFFFLISSFAFSAIPTTAKKVENLIYLINKFHCQPPLIDKAFSFKVMESYLYSIDGQCRYLYKKDINYLQSIQDKEQTPEQILLKSFEYLILVLEKRVKETDSLLASFSSSKFSWDTKEVIRFNHKFNDNYPENINEKKHQLNKWVKLYVLRRLEITGKLERDCSFEKNDDIKLKAIEKLRKNIGKEISTREINIYLEENLLNAIATTCDPHSAYFTFEEKKQFSESLSTIVESYGFTVEEDESRQVVISAIKPGSSAWRSNDIHKGDRILEIIFKGKPPIDITEYDVYEFEDFIGRSSEKEMDITLSKLNGTIVKAHLYKGYVSSDENTINSYLLSRETPIGYLPLPSFYTEYFGYTSLGCANDVAKEIVKLKKENIKGLILDLRNNGGGSMQEAIELAGIFLDMAPLCMVKGKNAKPLVLKDVNRGSIYDGPLLILINKLSASASEVLAQMLKTQHRAIIVGDNSFGKASAQLIIPLDTSYNILNPDRKYDEQSGYLKISIEKIYDLNGNTHQNTGVAPHIKIPDLWTKLPIGEKEYNNSLANDMITKKISVLVSPDEKITSCIIKSTERVSIDSNFSSVTILSDTFRNRYNRSYFAIHLDPVSYNQLLKGDAQFESLVNLVSVSDPDFKVMPNHQNKTVIQMDEFLNEIIKGQVDDLQKDIILREAYNILMDYNSNKLD